MRKFTSSLVTLGLAGMIAGGIAVGCSADGSTDIPGDSTGTDTNGTDPAEAGTPSTPTDNGGGGGMANQGGGVDAGKGGAKDAGKGGNTGDSGSSTLNTIYTRSCGFCGSQQAVCLANGAAGKVSDYSACSGEVADGCAPGSMMMEACGLCGTHQKICQNNCQWQAGSCTNEPMNACSPGLINNSGAGCSAGTYRQQTCGNDCKYGNFTMSCGAFVNPVTLQVPAVGAVVSAAQDIEPVVGKSWGLGITSTCPATTVKADNPMDYIELDNNTGKAAKVTIYQSAAPGGSELDTVLFVYNGSSPPADDASKKACVGKVSDSCATTALCGSASTFTFASLASVAIPAGGKILVYSSAYSSDTGKMMINVKTESLN
jgi:hypothetical protein